MYAVTTLIVVSLFNAIVAQPHDRAPLYPRSLDRRATSTTSTATAAAPASISIGDTPAVATTRSTSAISTVTIQILSSTSSSESKATLPSSSNLPSTASGPVPPPQSCLSNWDALASCAEATRQQGHPYLPTSASSNTIISSSSPITFPLLSSSSPSTSTQSTKLQTTITSSGDGASRNPSSSSVLALSPSTALGLAATSSHTTIPAAHSGPISSYVSYSSVLELPQSSLSHSSGPLPLSSSPTTGLPTTNTLPCGISLTSAVPSTYETQSRLLTSSTTIIFQTSTSQSEIATAPSTFSSQPQLTSHSSVSQQPGQTANPSIQSSSSIPTSRTSTTPLPPILIGTQPITKDASSYYRIGSQTVLPGSVVTVDGQRVSLASSGGALVINGDITNSPSSTAAAMIVVGSSTITANSASGFVVASQTLYPGSAITVSGVVMTLPKETASLTKGPAPTSAKVIVIGSSTFTKDSKSDLLIGSQILTPGGIITVDGQIVSLSPSGDGLVINGKTSQVTSSAPTTLATSFGSLISVPPISSLEIAGQTLTSGGKVTVGGEILSLAPSGTGITAVGTVSVRAAATSTGDKKPNGGERFQTGFAAFAVPLLLVGGFVLY